MKLWDKYLYKTFYHFISQKEKFIYENCILPNIMYKLDVKDKKLLFELDFDARLPNTQLAKRIGLSKQGVDYKINNLMKNKIITGFYPVINLPKLGYIYGRIFLKLQNLTSEKEQEMIKELVTDKRFHWIEKFEGYYDLFVGGWTKTLTEFKELSKDLMEKSL